MLVEVGFSTSSSWVSRAIEWVLGGEVSHAFFLVEDDTLGQLVYQAAGNGPELVTRALFERTHRVVARFPPAMDLSMAVRESIRKYVGYSYDYGADLSIAVNRAAKVLGFKVHVDFAEDHASECSALVVRTMLLAEPAYPGVGDLDPKLVDPVSLLEFMRAAPR